MSDMKVTEREIEDFKQDPVWIEMLKTWADRRAQYLEDLLGAKDFSSAQIIRGCVIEIDYTVQQPDLILLEIKQDKEDEKTEPDDESGETE